jgi:guanylate kinase
LKHSDYNPELENWIERIKKEEVTGEFDLMIVNDDLEDAYKQLKDFCLQRYWDDYDQDE